MGWFSPVKGEYPGLSQVDKTLPVGVDKENKAIERGYILTIASDSVTGDNASGDGVWNLAKSDSDTFYVALAGYTDPTSGFAGTAFVPNPTEGSPARPAISAIDLDQDGEYETSVYDTEGTYDLGDKLTVSNGKLAPAGGSGDEKIVGIVTRAPTNRWINNAIATPEGVTDPRLATRTGATMAVLRFKTAKA